MNLFDIIGPVMVGPSSSHTAGAVRIGYVARKLLKDTPVYADIELFGSFSATGKGHGTDRALVAGLLGMKSDDCRIPSSFSIAKDQGLKVFFEYSSDSQTDFHPNTAVINLQGKNGRKLCMQASSVGGGRIMVNRIDGITVNFSGETHTLIVHNYDTPGHVASVTNLLFINKINIASMNLYRVGRGSYAVMVLETDQSVCESIVSKIERIQGVIKVTYFDGEE
ncbi:MAG: L-serine ammonia-lyase, iron-sulfur-dependent subunit beta [Treponema sp.]|nr:L-serine ammonia-lyase, iron-sulfur-dependent subunit beta [Treponema sp.]